MVIPRDAGGNALVPDLTLRYPYRQLELRLGEPIPIDAADVSTRGIPVGGGMRIALAGLMTLAVLALYPILWVALPRRRRRLLALKYTAGDREIISTGYETGTRLSIGTGESAAAEYAQWTLGAAVPCWFNPSDPRDAIVIRGFGGAYFFALIPLPVFVFGVLGLRRR
jgi:hypothetical protein